VVPHPTGEEVPHKTTERALSVLIDFTSAFDTIDHDTVIKKLLAKGAGQYETRWVREFLTNRRGSLHFNGERSEWKTLTRGVPQGTVLGPLLFVVAMDDLLEKLDDLEYLEKKACHTVAFADDLTVTVGVQNLCNAVNQMNWVMRHIEDWCATSGLIINTSKTQAMLWSSAANGGDIEKTDRRLTLCGQPILNEARDGQFEKVVKLLGMQLDKSLSFHVHTAYVVQKANQGHSAIVPLTGRNFGCTRHANRVYAMGLVMARLLNGWEATGLAMSNESQIDLNTMWAKSAKRVAGCARSAVQKDALVEANFRRLTTEIEERAAIAHLRRLTSGDTHLAGLANHAGIIREVARLKNGQKHYPTERTWETMAHGGQFPPVLSDRLVYPTIEPWVVWHRDRIKIYYDLGLGDKKKADLSEEEQHAVCSEALQKRREEFAPSVVMYTDGSCIPGEDGGSAGAYVILKDSNPETPNWDWEGMQIMYEDAMHAGALACPYTAETVALHAGSDKLCEEDTITTLGLVSGSSVLIVVDCQGMLTSANRGPLLQRCWRVEQVMKNANLLAGRGITVVLQFIFSHCNILWNDYVDVKAKEMAQEAPRDRLFRTEFRDAKCLIRSNVVQRNRTDPDTKISYRQQFWANTAILEEEELWSRMKQAAASMMRTGRCIHWGELIRTYNILMDWRCRLCFPQEAVEEPEPEPEPERGGRRIEGPPIQCPYCERTNRRVARLNEHIRRDHPDQKLIKYKENAYQCTECPRQLRQFGAMERHYRENHRMDCPLQRTDRDCDTERKLAAQGKKEDVNPDELETIEHLTKCGCLAPARALWEEKKEAALEAAREKDGNESEKYNYEVSRTSMYLYLLREAMLLLNKETYEEDITVNRSEKSREELEELEVHSDDELGRDAE
jgi:hypothetical protein